MRLCADSEGYITRTGNETRHLQKGKEFVTSPQPILLAIISVSLQRW
jgi:hypothetical protein